jgi:predicted component of type VI protein secretion system
VSPQEGLHRSTPAELKERIEAERRGEPVLVYRDAAGGQRILVLPGDRSRVSVGRHPGCDIALTWDDEVSRVHADVERIGSVWTIVDDGRSRNGTFVNGSRLLGRRTLGHGDVIRIGGAELTFVDAGAQDLPSTKATTGQLGPAVSPAQRRVLVALCGPFAGDRVTVPPSNRELAEALTVSVDTVKTHLHALFEAFGLENLPQHRKRAELARLAIERGVVSVRELAR